MGDEIAAVEAWLRSISQGATAAGGSGQREVDLALGLLETAQVLVLVLDAEGRVVHLNRFGEQLTGYSLDELRGREWIPLFVPEAHIAGVSERFRRAILGDSTRGYVNPIRTREGRERIVDWHDRVLRDERGHVIALLAIAHDVTERFRALAALERANAELEARVAERTRALEEADRALEESRLRLATIVERSTEGMALLDREGRLRYLNPAAEQGLGVTSDEALGRTVSEIWRCDAALATGRAIARALERGSPLEWESDAPVAGRHLAGTAMPSQDGLVVVFRDVTERRLAEVAVLEREGRLREAQRIAQLGSWTLDLRTGVLEWSDEVYEIFEVRRDGFAARYEAFLARVHPEDRSLVDAEYRRSVEQRTAYDYVHRILLDEGRIKHVRERGRTDYDEHGAPLRSVGTVQDVTREVLAERSMAIKDAALESSLNAIAISTLEGELTYVNPAFVVLWGLDSAAAAVGRPVDAFWTDPEAAQRVAASVQREGAWSGRLEAEREDGETRMLEVAASLVRDSAGRPMCLMASFVDVTARVAAERDAERAAEALTIFKQLAETANQPIGIARPEGTVVYFNDAMRELFELPPDLPSCEVSVHDFYSAATLEWVAGEVRPRLASGRPWSAEVEIRTHQGRVRQTIHNTFAVRDLRGQPVGIANVITDISDRVEAERRLARSEAQFRAMFAQVSVGMVLTDLEGTILRANDRFCEIAARPREALVGTVICDLVAAEDAARGEALRERVAAGELESYTVEVRLPLADGSTRWAEIAVSAHVEQGAPVELLWVAQDVTARHEAELELRRSQGLLLRAESLAHLASWEWNLETGEFRGSPELYRQFAVEPGAGEDWRDQARARVHPEDLERVRAYTASVVATGTAPPIEYRIVRPDGEIRVLRAEASRASPDEPGSPVIFGFSQDTTEKKAAKERIEAQLREKEILLREIHHRVKNNLQVISSLLYFQAIRCEDPAVAKLFNESRDRVRAMSFVHETLYESADLGRVELGRYAETLTRALAASYEVPGCRVRFVVDAGPTSLDIEDAVPFGLVVSELVTNALKYAFVGRETGTIRVSLAPAGTGELRLTVADDGVGIAAGLERSGSLGLRLVRALTDQLRGRLEIHGDARGTRVTLVFPARAPSTTSPAGAG